MIMIAENVKGERYHLLIDLLARRCNRFAFVENRQLMEDEEIRLAYVDELIAGIKDQLLERKVQREWETTILGESTAFVFYFRLNNATIQFLKESSNSLFDWIGGLPEDLMFYKDDQCLLAACSHEGFFMIDESIWNLLK